MLRIALATRRNLPDWEVDDAPLHRALEARGAAIARPAWDDPAVDWAAFDACLIRSTWDYHERRDDFVAWAERVESLTRLFNPASVVRWNTHKTYLRDLEAAGVPVVPTVWIEPGSAVDPGLVMRECGWRRGFLKPAVGSTAWRTLRFDDSPAGLAAAREHLRDLAGEHTVLMQPYLDRVERDGEVSAVFIDGAFSHGVRKTPVPGDYRVQDDFGAADEPYRFSDEELGIAQHAVESTGFDLLYARADFIRDAGGDLRLNELELVEPSLFFRHAPGAAEALADGLLERLASPRARSD